MAIFPKTEFLSMAMKCSSFLGIFPVEFLFEENRYTRRCYSVYSKICFGYFLWFVFTSYMKLYLIINREVIDYAELSKNLIITPLFSITILRQMLILTPRFKRLLMEILDSDKYMDSIQDEEVKYIYRTFAKELNRYMKIYLGMVIVTECFFTSQPLVQPEEEMILGNGTFRVKTLPLSTWFPFNYKEHFLAAYLIQVVDIILGPCYDAYGEFLLMAAIAYTAVRLKILQHVLENLEKYQQRLTEAYGLRDNGVAEFVTVRECICYHGSIIAYVENFNRVMSTCMFLDFLQSSVHMACVLIKILSQGMSLIQLVSTVGYLVILNFRLFLYYYYANEVIFLSEGLSAAIYQSKWYEKTGRAKYMTFMIIMRNQKPLNFKLGLFGVMSLRKFLSILNAAYSYVMLIGSIK